MVTIVALVLVSLAQVAGPYFYDVVSGRNPTAVLVGQPLTNPTDFGTIVMNNNPLMMVPEMSSWLIGCAQGFYASRDKEELTLLMAMSLQFVERKYNGSTIAVSSGMREMPVVGSSRLFRLADGYMETKTYSFNAKTGALWCTMSLSSTTKLLRLTTTTATNPNSERTAFHRGRSLHHSI